MGDDPSEWNVTGLNGTGVRLGAGREGSSSTQWWVQAGLGAGAGSIEVGVRGWQGRPLPTPPVSGSVGGVGEVGWWVEGLRGMRDWCQNADTRGRG